jgi:hypothetical protein
MNKNLFSILIFTVAMATNSFGQILKVEVDGEARFTSFQNYTLEAGNDFPSSIESESEVQISMVYNNLLDIRNNPNQKWRLTIQKSDLTWNPALNLEARRTGNGYKRNSSGNPTITDGMTWQVVTNNPVYFFRGRDEIIYIPIKLKVNGYSLTMGASDFETSIVLTVYDDW